MTKVTMMDMIEELTAVNNYLMRVHQNPETKKWLKIAEARGCGCNKAIYLATVL